MNETQICKSCHDVRCGWIDITNNNLTMCTLKKRIFCLDHRRDVCMCTSCNGTGMVSWIDNLFIENFGKRNNEKYYSKIRKFLDKYKVNRDMEDEDIINRLVDNNKVTNVIFYGELIIINNKDCTIPYKGELPEV